MWILLQIGDVLIDNLLFELNLSVITSFCLVCREHLRQIKTTSCEPTLNSSLQSAAGYTFCKLLLGEEVNDQDGDDGDKGTGHH